MKYFIELVLFFTQFLISKRSIEYFGARIIVPKSLDLKTRLQIYSRRYEKAEINAIMKYYKDSNSLLEIGGGAGILASVIDHNCKPKKHAIFEAINDNYEWIKRQKLLPSTTNRNFAVISSLSTESSLRFRARERIFGSGFLSEGSESIESDRFIEVPTISINEVLQEEYDIILLDVEGYEEFLLPDIASLSNATIIFEYHHDKCQIPLSKLFALCPGHNFTHFQDCTFIGQPNSHQSN